MPLPADFTLQKSERLCSKKAFEFLFNRGRSLYNPPLKLIFTLQYPEGEPGIQIAFGVSKKFFKRAVKRNRIKRMLREIYRQHKPELPSEKNILLMVMYTSKELLPYHTLETSFLKLLEELSQRVQKNH